MREVFARRRAAKIETQRGYTLVALGKLSVEENGNKRKTTGGKGAH